MKKHIIGIFNDRQSAEKAINAIHVDAGVSNDEISYLYRNTDNQIKQVEADDVASDTVAEGAGKGASTGAVIGAIAGLAAVAGVLPVIGPLVVAGPLLASLGIAGAAGATAAGAIGGAAVGGLIGGLVNIGVGKERAQKYEDDVMAGRVLVMVNSENNEQVQNLMSQAGATDVETYAVNI